MLKYETRQGETMKKIIVRIISILLLIFTFITIFGFSAQDGEKSGSLSNKVTTIFVNHFPYTKDLNVEAKQELIEHAEPIVRKLAHFSIYTLVGIGMMTLMCTFELKLKTRMETSLLVGVIYAISDEIHQSFVPRQRTIIERCLH